MDWRFKGEYLDLKGKILQVDKESCYTRILIICTLHQLFSRTISFACSFRSVSLHRTAQTCSEFHLSSYTVLTWPLSSLERRVWDGWNWPENRLHNSWSIEVQTDIITSLNKLLTLACRGGCNMHGRNKKCFHIYSEKVKLRNRTEDMRIFWNVKKDLFPAMC